MVISVNSTRQHTKFQWHFYFDLFKTSSCKSKSNEKRSKSSKIKNSPIQAKKKTLSLRGENLQSKKEEIVIQKGDIISNSQTFIRI